MVHTFLRRGARISIFCAIFACIAASPPDSAAPFNTTIQISGGQIDLSAPDHLPVPDAVVTRWVHRAAEAISDFYGRYPVKNVTLTIHSDGGGAVHAGKEFGGRRIRISLGSDTQPSDLDNDWMLTHEMFHLSQPDLDDDYSWMSEGMADYLEPVARVRVGQITTEKFWQDLVDGLPQGLPQPGDRGLDHTPTWGRTYWGGSLYWLLADIRVRQQTNNKKSVRDAALVALNTDGDGSHLWPLDQLLQTYDRGTGTTVFTTLHNEMGNKPDPIDLPDLWKSLGVIPHADHVTFDDSAPMADIRKGITER